jgi:signal transduction histidine kinase
MSSARAAGREPLRVEVLVGWTAAALTVLVVYVVVVLGGGALIDRTDSPHVGLSLLATALVALVAEPVRTRVQRLVARRLSRPSRSPYDVLADFSRDVARPETGEQAPAVIARMLAQGTGVEWAQVWVQVGGRLRLVASHPAGAGSDVPSPALYETRPQPGIRSVTVARTGRPIGVLRVKEYADRPMSPVEERLLGGLAAQAGLVLEAAQLREELAVRLEQLTLREQQLRTARQELVATQDLERRRLERDIHDGAQQQLVALAINLKVAKALGDTDPAQARQVLDEQLQAADDAIRTLRDLSSGLPPEALTSRGLAAALSEATAANPVPVHVDVAGVHRLPAAVEGALYFCALEAVQNATKHAGATAIYVRLRFGRADGGVTLTVEDDGTGIGSVVRPGSGLANMRERIASVGGRFRVDAGVGGGTTVTVHVPTASAGPTVPAGPTGLAGPTGPAGPAAAAGG